MLPLHPLMDQLLHSRGRFPGGLQRGLDASDWPSGDDVRPLWQHQPCAPDLGLLTTSSRSLGISCMRGVGEPGAPWGRNR